MARTYTLYQQQWQVKYEILNKKKTNNNLDQLTFEKYSSHFNDFSKFP